MNKFFIDTNIIIDYMKKKNDCLGEFIILQDKRMAQLYINPVVLTEYFTDRNMEEEQKRVETTDFFNYFTVINIGTEIGYLAAELMRKRFVPVIGDALHAATCLSHHLELVSRNTKHFKNVPRLKIYPIYN